MSERGLFLKFVHAHIWACLPARLFGPGLKRKREKAMVSAGLTELGAVIPSGLRAFLLALATRTTITVHLIDTGTMVIATVNVINSTSNPTERIWYEDTYYIGGL